MDSVFVWPLVVALLGVYAIHTFESIAPKGDAFFKVSGYGIEAQLQSIEKREASIEASIKEGFASLKLRVEEIEGRVDGVSGRLDGVSDELSAFAKKTQDLLMLIHDDIHNLKSSTDLRLTRIELAVGVVKERD